MPRITQGIITGCDAEQEWMLAWWWECLRKHNSYPVCFFDFGMSEAARKWCEERGEVITLRDLPFQIASEKEVDPLRKMQWEERNGKAVWRVRTPWFKKPFAIVCSPFEHGLWLDLDCEVRGCLDLIFNHLWLGATLVMRPASEALCSLQRQFGWLQEGEILYTSGALGFRHNTPVLQSWVEEVRLHSDLYVADDLALTRVIWKTKWPVVSLPNTYNWELGKDEFNNPVIIHYTGGLNKVVLRERIISKGLLFTGNTCLG